jgi:pimeloyl-ACP methyl ester carboxylesterase
VIVVIEMPWWQSGAVAGPAAAKAAARMRAAGGWLALRRGVAVGVVAVLGSVALGGCGSSPAMAPGTASVVSAPVRVAHTRLGDVGYRAVGSGPPLVLIMGYGWTMEGWDPRLVHALALHHRVVMFDNSGVGLTQPLAPPLTIDAMADQTSALISALGLGRPDVLGWSMGGMIAQALAVQHPAQVRRLVLCATYPGTGAAVPPSQAAIQAGHDFPANQAAAFAAFQAAILEYPGAASPPWAPAGAKGAQGIAAADWWDGTDPAGHKIAAISAPTLIADGTDDQLDPVANDHLLARLIPRATLVLYPDAGHGFLFQEPTRFAALIDSFLTGHPSP